MKYLASILTAYSFCAPTCWKIPSQSIVFRACAQPESAMTAPPLISWIFEWSCVYSGTWFTYPLSTGHGLSRAPDTNMMSGLVIVCLLLVTAVTSAEVVYRPGEWFSSKVLIYPKDAECVFRDQSALTELSLD